MTLLLHEAILLFAIDDKKGHWTELSGYLNYGFAAAILLDLLEEEKVALEEGRVVVKNHSRMGNKVLDQALQLTGKPKKPNKVTNWLHNIVIKSSPLYKAGLQHLIRQGILKQTYKKVLWIFKLKRYPTVNIEPERELREHLRAVVAGTVQGQPRDRQLLKLLAACEMLRSLYADKADRKTAKATIEAMPVEGKFGEHLAQAIQEMQAAIMVSTTAAVG
jgi:Golgi phosphoprotein 3